MQLDYDALLVLKIGDGAALNDRHAGGDRRIVAGEIRRTGQVIDFTLGVDSSCANVRDRYARQFERVLLLVFAVVKSAVSPGVSYAHGDRAPRYPKRTPRVSLRVHPAARRRLPPQRRPTIKGGQRD